jgi:hypothetical protein
LDPNAEVWKENRSNAILAFSFKAEMVKVEVATTVPPILRVSEPATVIAHGLAMLVVSTNWISHGVRNVVAGAIPHGA